MLPSVTASCTWGGALDIFNRLLSRQGRRVVKGLVGTMLSMLWVCLLSLLTMNKLLNLSEGQFICKMGIRSSSLRRVLWW